MFTFPLSSKSSKISYPSRIRKTASRSTMRITYAAAKSTENPRHEGPWPFAKHRHGENSTAPRDVINKDCYI
jgi:hypothetical protein